MGVYSIKDLERLSGIKAHTLRVWEKRYSVIQPKRTTTNIRFYDDNDLKKVINLSILNNSGFKISKLAQLQEKSLKEKAFEQAVRSRDKDDNVELLILSMIYVDELRFEETLGTVVEKFGFEEAFIKVVFPFLEQVGVLWHVGTIDPAQEHFISNLIRRKLLAAIDRLSLPSKDAKPVLIFLPEGELHEIGLLFYYYLARQAGFRVFYLGQSVPYDDLENLARKEQYELVITAYINPVALEELTKDLDLYQRVFEKASILITGAQVARHQKGLRKFDRVHVIKSAADLRAYI